jgi:predicted enzyme related to lactoylglutathione lyase
VELVERSLPANAEQAGRAGHVILEVNDIKAAHELAMSRGAKEITATVRTAGKGWTFDVFDPDGTMVTFEQSEARH